jgi:ribosomal protein S11
MDIRKVMINMTGPAIVLRKPLFRQIREQTDVRVMKLRTSDSVPHGGCRPRKSRRRRYKTKARRR